MITCPSSLEVRRLDRRADSITAPRYLPSQKLGPELGVKGRRVRTSQGAHPCARSAATVVAGGCHQLITPSPRFNRLLAPCPRRALTAGDSRSIAGSSGWPLPAQPGGPPRWIARIKLVPKLTVRVRFPSPAPCAPCAKGGAIHTNWVLCPIWSGVRRHPKSAVVPLPRAITHAGGTVSSVSWAAGSPVSTGLPAVSSRSRSENGESGDQLLSHL